MVQYLAPSAEKTAAWLKHRVALWASLAALLAACGAEPTSSGPQSAADTAADSGGGGGDADGGQGSDGQAADTQAGDAQTDGATLADAQDTGAGSDGAAIDGADGDAKLGETTVGDADSADSKDSKDGGGGGAGSCAGKCGSSGSSGNCYCDSICLEYGDCCDDYEALCLCKSDAECQGGDSKCAASFCKGGECKTTAKDCDDKNACTVDSCNPADGSCSNALASDGAKCPNLGCQAGSCKAGVCKANGNAVNGSDCDDADPCTESDECADGKCAGAVATDCDDFNACTVDSCNKTSGCVHTPAAQNAVCDDGDACTSGDACISGQCDGQPMAEGSGCDDEDSCTGGDQCVQGYCEGSELPDNSPCDDGDPCTLEDVCGFGFCNGDYNDCEDGNACTDDNCLSDTGGCENKLMSDGSKCSDDNDCTATDVCQGGACQGAVEADGTSCSDGNDCTDQEKCKQGQCIGVPDSTADGQLCDDNDGCTSDEVCSGGSCAGPADTAICDDQDPCTLDSCANAFGSAKCSHSPAGAGVACSDGDPCNVGATCQAGKCQGGANKCSSVWSDAVDCGGEAAWSFSAGPSASQVGWAIDGSPNPPAPHSGACSLNFNDGKDFDNGQTVKGSVTSKAQALAAGSDYVLSFWSLHDVETSKSFDLRRVQVSANGFAGPALIDVLLPNDALSNVWSQVKLAIPGAAGKSVQVRFAFDSVDGMGNSGVGWFVDDVSISKVAK